MEFLELKNGSGLLFIDTEVIWRKSIFLWSVRMSAALDDELAKPFMAVPDRLLNAEFRRESGAIVGWRSAHSSKRCKAMATSGLGVDKRCCSVGVCWLCMEIILLGVFIMVVVDRWGFFFRTDWGCDGGGGGVIMTRFVGNDGFSKIEKLYPSSIIKEYWFTLFCTFSLF